MKKNYLAIVILCGTLSFGCAAQSARQVAKNQWLNLAGAFEAAQLVMSTRLNAPSVTQEEKELYSKISQEGVMYLEVAEIYINEGKLDDWNRVSQTISELLQYTRPILIEKFAGEEGGAE